MEARKLLDQGDFTGASAIADALLAKEERNPAAHHLKGKALYGLARYTEAYSSYFRSLELSGGNRMVEESAKAGMSECRHAQAFGFYEQGDYKKALEYIALAIEDNRKNAQARLFRGRVLELSGDSDAAVAEFREVVAENQSSPDAHYFLAKALVARNDLASAVDSFERLLIGSTDSIQRSEAHYYLGEAARDASDFRAAKEHFRKALEANPDMKAAAASLAASEERMAGIRRAASAEAVLAVLAVSILAAYSAVLAAVWRKLGAK